jgi:hypothetical protein
MTTDKESYCLSPTSHPAPDDKTSSVETPSPQDGKVAKIRELNDRLRKCGHGGMWLATIGISSLPPDDMRSVYEAVLTFDAFNADNDPYGEHDCAAQTVGNVKVIWKIDYYDRARQFLSPDPSDPKVTVRVLTVMLASEY